MMPDQEKCFTRRGKTRRTQILLLGGLCCAHGQAYFIFCCGIVGLWVFNGPAEGGIGIESLGSQLCLELLHDVFFYHLLCYQDHVLK